MTYKSIVYSTHAQERLRDRELRVGMLRWLMEIHYDPSVDAVGIRFTTGFGKRLRTVEVAPGVHIDLDAENHVVAFELLDASDHIPLEALTRLPSGEIMLTLAEAAKESGHSPATLRVLINQGRLKGKKQGRDWLVSLTDVWNYLESREARGPKTKLPRRTREALKRKRAAVASAPRPSRRAKSV